MIIPRKDVRPPCAESEYGEQVAAIVLKRRKISIADAAAAIGVSEAHLRSCLAGHTRPQHKVCTGLPKLVNMRLDLLFTQRALPPRRRGTR